MKIIDKDIKTLQELADIVFNGGFFYDEEYIFTKMFVNNELNWTPLYITIYDIHRDCCSCKLGFENKERFFDIVYEHDNDEGTEERYKDMCNQLISNIIDFVVMEKNS